MPEKINQKPAWLVSWNVKAWNWDDYEKACANTKQGKSYTKAWACFSTKPQVGDEVFLIKLGSGKRGIIGHGYVIKQFCCSSPNTRVCTGDDDNLVL